MQHKLLYMSEFENKYKVCMELIKQKSREVLETGILLMAMKDLFDKLEMEENTVEASKNRKRCPCFYLVLLYIVAL